MAYLITHIAISLVFADLLGLLLGWLIWGYASRQKGQEVEVLRERLGDMQMALARQMAIAPEPRAALSGHEHGLTGGFLEAELPERAPARRAFFEDQGDDPLPLPLPMQAPPPIAPDLEVEVQESRFQHLQQQVRDLEGYRDRIPLMQADLSDALAGRRTAEAKFQEAKNDFDVRSSSLLSQIRDFEEAAAEWDRLREELELEKINNEKELAAVKATLRDLQNSQRPQAVETPAAAPSASAVELSDLRERYQRALKERDAIAAELEFWKQSDGLGRHNDGERVSDLEEAVRIRDTQLAEQAARVESLLWRVAELEPFAAEAPKKEEHLRRQESEIAGHMAMHSENAERIRSLQNHIGELQATTIPSDEFQRIVAEHQSEVQHLSTEHEARLAEMRQSLAMKDDEISEHLSARSGQENLLKSMQSRIGELEADVKNMRVLERTLTEREAEIRSLLTAHGEMQREMESWKSHAMELEPIALRVPQLEASLSEHTGELKRVRAALSDKEGQLTFLEERLSVLSSRLAAHQQQVLQLEPIAARTPDLERQLVERQHQAEEQLRSLQERHLGELTRLKVNSGQRIRRFRQSLNGLKH